jgi:integrase
MWSGFLRTKKVKKSTMEIYEDAQNRFYAKYPVEDEKTGFLKDIAVFHEADIVGAITPEQIIDWKNKLLENYKYTTVAKIVKNVKTVFTWAVNQKWINESPLDGIGRGSFIDKSKDRIITMDEYRLILEACPNQMWRTIIALARIGGLRCPSEIKPLRWKDINFEKSQFTIRSPKTEQHEGKELRVIPLFNNLRDELKKMEQTGNEFVIGDFSPLLVNEIIKIAGLTNVARPFDNMRMTRSNEVYRQFGAHCETAWIGHSSRVREDHYMMILPEDIAKAASSVVTE